MGMSLPPPVAPDTFLLATLSEHATATATSTLLLSQPLAQVSDEQTLILLPSAPETQVLKNGTPQLLLLDAAGQNLLHTASLVQLPANQQLSLLPTPSISLVHQPSVELLHLTSNTIFLAEAEQPVLLCLQNPSLQSLPHQAFHATQPAFVVEEGIQESAASQAALAKSWHNDADLVNRAMLALNRQPTGAGAMDQLPPLTCSPSSQTLPSDARVASAAIL